MHYTETDDAKQMILVHKSRDEKWITIEARRLDAELAALNRYAVLRFLVNMDEMLWEERKYKT